MSAATIWFQLLKVYPDFSNAFLANGSFSDLSKMESVSTVDIAKILISVLARTVEIFAKMPVRKKSKGPSTLIQDQSVSDFSELTWVVELQTIDNSSSVLLIE